MTCPICSYQMDAFDKDCPRCHGQQPVQSTPVPTNPPPPPSPPQVPNHHSRFCPHCGAGMSASMQFCPACHKSNTSPAVPQQPSSKTPLHVALAGVAGLAGMFLFNNIFSVGNSSSNTNSSSNSPSPTASAKPAFAPPVTVPTPTTIPTVVPIPTSQPQQNRPSKVTQPRQPRLVKTTPTRLVEVLSGQIREASSIEDLEDIRSIVARLRLDFSMSEQDLNERGYYFDSTMGPGLMKGVMDSLWDAIDQKRLALKNETGMGNIYLQSCESQLMTAGIQASQVKGTVTLNVP